MTTTTCQGGTVSSNFTPTSGAFTPEAADVAARTGASTLKSGHVTLTSADVTPKSAGPKHVPPRGEIPQLSTPAPPRVTSPTPGWSTDDLQHRGSFLEPSDVTPSDGTPFSPDAVAAS